jgi:hypothetical protein
MWGQRNLTIAEGYGWRGFISSLFAFPNPFLFAFGRDFLLRTQKTKEKEGSMKSMQQKIEG